VGQSQRPHQIEVVDAWRLGECQRYAGVQAACRRAGAKSTDDDDAGELERHGGVVKNELRVLDFGMVGEKK